MTNPFDSARKLLNRNGMTIRERLDCFFVDSNLMPLMIQENYLSSVQKGKLKRSDFHKIVLANKSFTLADVIDKNIRK